VGALSLVLAASGLAAASHFTLATRPAADTQDPVVDPAPVVDTTATWEDVDGNGIDDDCQTTPAEANTDAAAAADQAADLNGDGVLSQSEAAQSGRIGGKNCNHGGYVSAMAHAKHDCTTPPATEPTDGDTTEPTNPTVTLTLAGDDEQGEDADEQGADAEDGDEAKDESGDAPACDADTKVSDHEAAKEARTAAHDAAKAERDAKKAEAKAARDAAKAERKAAHANAKAAAHAKHANKGKSHSH
jgi:hypothetical protein